MMTLAAYTFSSTSRWQDPEDVGNYFIVPTTAITDTDQKYEEMKWQARKNLLDTHRNMRTALQQLFERFINRAYHSGGMTNIGMARQGFVNNEPPAILKRLNILYGTPSLQELYQALLRIHYPMYLNQPVKVMLSTTEEVQMFLVAHPDGDREHRDVNLMSYTMIKLYKCGGLYTRAVERWKIKTKEDKKIWANFRQHLIAEYENLLEEVGGTTLGQEWYGTEFGATEATMGESSIAEYIVCYVERATAAEGGVQALEDRLNQF